MKEYELSKDEVKWKDANIDFWLSSFQHQLNVVFVGGVKAVIKYSFTNITSSIKH